MWKYENETLTNKPENVMIASWLPQRDILAHPNVKLFITHGGLLGVTEAITEGVPCLGIPLFADQKMNMLKAEQLGYGKIINYNEMTEETIFNSINEVLSKFEYGNNAKKISKLFGDRQTSPQQNVVFWSEYVIRNNGAAHFKSAAHDLNYFQLNLIDSYLFVISVIGLIMFAIYQLFAIMIKRILKIFIREKIKTL